jgi:biopolymer transport protein ExbB/TolQ
VVFFITVSFRKINNSEQTLRKINTVKSLGIFALIIGILGQLIGLFSAFRAIRFGEVEASPEIFAEGFKISMIPIVYGILIFTFSIILWFLLKRVLKSFYKSFKINQN